MTVYSAFLTTKRSSHQIGGQRFAKMLLYFDIFTRLSTSYLRSFSSFSKSKSIYELGFTSQASF